MNIIETMKQALKALVQCQQQLSSDWTHFTTATEAITNLRAAIDAVEKQEPAAYANLDARIDVMDRALFLRCEKEAADKYHENCYDLTVLFTHPAPTQSDSKPYLLDPNCKCDEHGACSYCWEGKKQK